MNHSVYQESFLPLRFFLNTIVVCCPSCSNKAQVTTDVPPVASQEQVLNIFYDGQTAYYKNYLWTRARFFCSYCQKKFEIDKNALMKTWYGPVECVAEDFCPVCLEAGHKKQLAMVKKFKSKNKLPQKIELTCSHCMNTSTLFFTGYPLEQSSLPIDPICGLPLFLTKEFKKETIWAYNLEHLEHMEAYLKAKQRKQIFGFEYASKYSVPNNRDEVMSFSEQLPKIFKLEANRAAILKILHGLKQLLV